MWVGRLIIYGWNLDLGSWDGTDMGFIYGVYIAYIEVCVGYARGDLAMGICMDMWLIWVYNMVASVDWLYYDLALWILWNIP